MQHIFYISTGAKNARYTLRHQRFIPGCPFQVDNYICNLADDIDRAAEKAQNYFDRIKSRFEDAIVVLVPDDEIGKRRGKLSLKASRQMEMIERGVFPFGKYINQEFASVPDSYILYWADMLQKVVDAVPMTIASVCMGIAMDRDLIATREAKKEVREFTKLISQHEGQIGERRQFEGEIFSVYYNQDYGFYNTQILLDNGNIVSYAGNKMADRGEQVRFVARISAHGDYKGTRTTKVKRPTMKKL